MFLRSMSGVVKSDSFFGEPGDLMAWGYNGNGQLGTAVAGDKSLPTEVAGEALTHQFTSIAAGYYHSLAIDSDGKLWAWGNNGNGQLGTATGDKSLPTEVAGEALTHQFTSIASGYLHSLGIIAS